MSNENVTQPARKPRPLAPGESPGTATQTTPHPSKSDLIHEPDLPIPNDGEHIVRDDNDGIDGFR